MLHFFVVLILLSLYVEAFFFLYGHFHVFERQILNTVLPPLSTFPSLLCHIWIETCMLSETQIWLNLCFLGTGTFFERLETSSCWVEEGVHFQGHLIFNVTVQKKDAERKRNYIDGK